MIEPAPILLFPCNGNSREALDCLGNSWVCKGFIDDTPDKQNTEVAGLPVHDRTALVRWPEAKVLAVPGGPQSFLNRQQVIESLGIASTRFANVVHPSAMIGDAVHIGYNTLIMAGVVLTSNVHVGNHCCILPNTVVHHDSHIDDWTLTGANVTVSGGVSIGRNCYVGSASSIMNGLAIGHRALVGFGANVIRDLPGKSCVVGNPARVIGKSDSSSIQDN